MDTRKHDYKVVLDAWKIFKQNTKGIKDKSLKMRIKHSTGIIKNTSSKPGRQTIKHTGGVPPVFPKISL